MDKKKALYHCHIEKKTRLQTEPDFQASFLYLTVQTLFSQYQKSIDVYPALLVRD